MDGLVGGGLDGHSGGGQGVEHAVVDGLLELARGAGVLGEGEYVFATGAGVALGDLAAGWGEGVELVAPEVGCLAQGDGAGGDGHECEVGVDGMVGRVFGQAEEGGDGVGGDEGLDGKGFETLFEEFEGLCLGQQVGFNGGGVEAGEEVDVETQCSRGGAFEGEFDDPFGQQGVVEEGAGGAVGGGEFL